MHRMSPASLVGRAALCAAALCSLASLALAQGVGINGTGAPADTSAILDLTSTSKGFLPPRLSTVQRNTIVLPATGLVIYQTDGVQGLYFNAGTPAAPNWKQVADTGGGSGQWSTSGTNLYYTAGQVAVGTSSFSAGLTVSDPLNGLRVATANAGGAVASFGGVGTFRVDAPFIVGGRLQLLENGYLGLGRTAPVSRLDIAGGAGDLVATEGDFRIGDGSTRLKFGITTSGTVGAATIMEQGAPGQYNVLALGSQGNKVLYVNGNSQRVGIGTDAPNAPLGFPPTLGKKITFYPGAGGDVGIGVSGNRLQLYGDYPNADVALGQDQAGTFIERFAVKPTGALAVNGNAGSGGQVLQSNGAGSAATWVSPTNSAYNNVYQVISNDQVTLTSSSPQTLVPGLSQTFSVATAAKVVASFSVPVHTDFCIACGATAVFIDLRVDVGIAMRYRRDIGNGQSDTYSGLLVIPVGPGTHTIDVVAASIVGPNTTFGCDPTCSLHSTLTLQVIPQ